MQIMNYQRIWEWFILFFQCKSFLRDCLLIQLVDNHIWETKQNTNYNFFSIFLSQSNPVERESLEAEHIFKLVQPTNTIKSEIQVSFLVHRMLSIYLIRNGIIKEHIKFNSAFILQKRKDISRNNRRTVMAVCFKAETNDA